MARCLIISALQVFPPLSGGHRRTAMLAEGLAQNGFEIRIHSLIGRKADMLKGAKSGVFRTARGVEEFVGRPRLVWLIAMLFYKLKLPPFWARWGYHKERLALDLDWADVIIYDFPFVFPQNPPKKLLVVNSHNVEARLIGEKSALGKKMRDLVSQREADAAKRCDLISVSSPEEKQFFSAIVPNQKIHLVPNCVAEERFFNLARFRKSQRSDLEIADDQTVLFFAASSYGPNYEGFEFLSEFSLQYFEILNELNMVFLICGSVTKSASRRSTMITTGPVAEIEPYFAAADWAVNPIFNGSGTSIKLAEMIAASLPVLTTPTGARGFDLTHGKSALLFERDTLLERLKTLNLFNKQSLAKEARTANGKFLNPLKAVEPLAQILSDQLEGRPAYRKVT